jgi:hypothetical protein
LKPIQVPDAGLWQRKISVLQIQQPVAVHHVAVHDESGNAARVPDVLRGIGIDDENAGAAAGGNISGFRLPPVGWISIPQLEFPWSRRGIILGIDMQDFAHPCLLVRASRCI